MAVATAHGLSLDYEVRGPADAPPVLLIQGLGMPAAMWPDPFVATLLDAGLRVILFDNRDSGASTRLTDAGVPDIPRSLLRALRRQPVSAPYNLADMARDAVGVLDAAQAERAHVVGISMGGMIAQVLAAQAPHRVRTLTSIMSTTGNPQPRIAFGKLSALVALLRRPPREPTIAQGVAHLERVFDVIGSPGFRQDRDARRALFERAARRGIYPPGTARQLAAIMSSGDRRAELRTITAPTLVIHGADDPLVRVAGGIDTARNIPGARLKIIPGMGHDLPAPLLHGLATLIAEHCRAAVNAPSSAPALQAPDRAA